MKYKIVKFNQNITYVNRNMLTCFPYDRSVLLSSFVVVVCCDVIYVPLYSVNSKLFFFVELC